MNEKEYLFLSLDSNNLKVAEIFSICQDFTQIHIHSQNLLEKLPFLSPLKDMGKELYLYCFTQEDYSCALENNIVPHICWLNEDIKKDSWIDHLILNHKEDILKYEFFWMIGEEFVSTISGEDTLKISQKLQSYSIPLCFNFSKVFNQNNSFIKINAFIKEIHKVFNNPLYKKEFNNLYSNEGNYFLNNNLQLEKILMGFYGDIINAMPNELINIKNMNKSKECLNCELHENCTHNKMGYFMHYYDLIKCCGPKLMRFNQS